MTFQRLKTIQDWLEIHPICRASLNYTAGVDNFELRLFAETPKDNPEYIIIILPIERDHGKAEIKS